MATTHRIALTLLLVLIPVSAFAQRAFVTTPVHFYVSENGTDAGVCPSSAPCRTIDYAHKISATQYDYGATCGPTIHVPLGVFSNANQSKAQFIYPLIGGGCYDGGFVGGPRTEIVGDDAAYAAYHVLCGAEACFRVLTGRVEVHGLTCNAMGRNGGQMCIEVLGSGTVATAYNVRLQGYMANWGQAFGYGEGGALYLGRQGQSTVIQVATNLYNLLTGSTQGRASIYPGTSFDYPQGGITIVQSVNGEGNMVVSAFGIPTVTGAGASQVYGAPFWCASNTSINMSGFNFPGNQPGMAWTDCVVNGYIYRNGVRVSQ